MCDVLSMFALNFRALIKNNSAISYLYNEYFELGFELCSNTALLIVVLSRQMIILYAFGHGENKVETFSHYG